MRPSMQLSMRPSAIYQERADLVLQLADHSADADERMALREWAVCWLILAERAEQTEVGDQRRT